MSRVAAVVLLATMACAGATIESDLNSSGNGYQSTGNVGAQFRFTEDLPKWPNFRLVFSNGTFEPGASSSLYIDGDMWDIWFNVEQSEGGVMSFDVQAQRHLAWYGRPYEFDLGPVFGTHLDIRPNSYGRYRSHWNRVLARHPSTRGPVAWDYFRIQIFPEGRDSNITSWTGFVRGGNSAFTPEPGTLSLMVVAFGALAFRQRRVSRSRRSESRRLHL